MMHKREIKIVVKFCSADDLTADERYRIQEGEKNLKSEIVSMIRDIVQGEKK